MRTSSTRQVLLGVGIAALLGSGCSTKPPKQAGDDAFGATSYEGGKDDIDQPEVARADPNTPDKGRSSDTPTTPTPQGMEGLDEDQKDQMKVALRRGASKAAQCPGVVKGAATGKGDVQVVFDGQKGRASDAIVGSPFAGTEVDTLLTYTVSKNCILTAGYSHFFAGDYLDDTGSGDDADFFYLMSGLKF